MRRLNFLEDEPWNEVHDELRTRVRWFGHPFDADMLGASLHELLPGAEGGPLHMHYGVLEMFFVLAGTPAVRTPEGEEGSQPEMSCTSQKAPTDCTPSRIPRTNRRDYSQSPPNGSPTSSHTPSEESHGWRRVILSGRLAKAPTRGSSPALSCHPSSQTRSSGDIPERSTKSLVPIPRGRRSPRAVG